MSNESSKSSKIKNECANDDVDTCCLLIDESLNNGSKNTTDCFLKALLVSNFIFSSSFDDD